MSGAYLNDRRIAVLLQLWSISGDYGMDFLVKALSCVCLSWKYVFEDWRIKYDWHGCVGIFVAALSNILIMNGFSNQIVSGVLGFVLILSILLTVIKKRDIGQVTIF